MSRARYSFTDAEGNTLGLMTFSQLKDLEIEGKIKPDSVITDFSKITERRADSIPGIFSLGSGMPPKMTINPAYWDKTAGQFITLVGVMNVCLTIYILVDYYSLSKTSPSLSTMMSMGRYPVISWVIVFAEIAALIVAAKWIKQSKRLGFGLALALNVVTLVSASPYYGSSANTLLDNLRNISYLGTVACFIYCFLRLTGCYGEAPEA
ncbi:MAG: hypothetical protein K8R88_09325 [Armatimonadetes bacterium]|nr:hypothetical protein [Armatimonadota bacterium]